MGAVGSRVGALLDGLRDTPWPDAERLMLWASDAGDDARAAWVSCERADDLLAVAAAWDVPSREALARVASFARDAAALIGLRAARVTRVAFAAEHGGGKSSASRTKLLDDAKSLLADAEAHVGLIAKQTKPSRILSYRAAMEVGRATGFLALAIVSEGASPAVHANLAHAVRQLAAAFAAARLASAGGDAADGETSDALRTRLAAAVDASATAELTTLGSKLRAALATDFERAVASAAG
jgi:hypothetical protein